MFIMCGDLTKREVEREKVCVGECDAGEKIELKKNKRERERESLRM